MQKFVKIAPVILHCCIQNIVSVIQIDLLETVNRISFFLG